MVSLFQNDSFISYVFYGVVVLLALYITLKVLKLPLKILINSLSGFITLFLVNYSMVSYNLEIPINIITSLITGFLGIPGILILIVYFYFL